MWYTTHMNTKPTVIKRALISVSDKTGIVALARVLISQGIEIISTGGTASLLQSEGIAVIPVEKLTQFPEMMNGRVKSLHPIIAGGILGLRNQHASDAKTHGIPWIDLVVCNLYPFAQTINNNGTSLDDAVENIDIGGPTMVRSAAKNFSWVTVLTYAADYDRVASALTSEGSVPYALRKELATKAFGHTASYDALIHQYLNEEQFPAELTLTYELHTDTRRTVQKEDRLLRYGENPHQRAAVYRGRLVPGKTDPFSLLQCAVLQGKQLSFNNLGDTQGAIDTLREFSEPACVVVKHATPCGVAVHEDITKALTYAFEADSRSAFGGIIAVNRVCNKKMAEFLSSIFFEVLTAPSFTEEALVILKKKKNLRVLETGPIPPLTNHLTSRALGSDLLIQERDNASITRDDITVATHRAPTDDELADLLFAWKVVKHVKSNAIVTAAQRVTCGIGGGQVSRVDATLIALTKSGAANPMVLASDAFFPFRDSIDALKGSGVRAIIQPGGSIRDQEVVDACNEADIAMVYTGIRGFLHG